MQNSDDQDFKQLQRHSQFYLNGGDLHLLVDNVHFRVHRYFFERESQKFRDMILAPRSPEYPPRGDSDSTAIVLNIPVEDFEMLLGVFYNPRYSVYEWTVSDWTRILTLAHDWEFNEIKNLAIRELEKQAISLINPSQKSVEPNRTVAMRPIYMPLTRTYAVAFDDDVKLGHSFPRNPSQAKTSRGQLGSLRGSTLNSRSSDSTAITTQTSCGLGQSDNHSPRSSEQQLQRARSRLRTVVSANRPRMIPEPPAQRPAVHHSPAQPVGPSHVGRPIVKNPTLSSLFSATVAAPSPHQSSPLGPSQHPLRSRRGFPHSKPKPDLYRHALMASSKTSRHQQLLRVAGKRNTLASKRKVRADGSHATTEEKENKGVHF